MQGQATLYAFNSSLSVVMIIVFGLATGSIGFYCGKLAERPNANRRTQVALERTHRDIRALRERIYGHLKNPLLTKALQQAEYIAYWRSLGPKNWTTKPDGTDRMRPANIPRSRMFKQDRHHANLRTAVFSRLPLDDTGFADVKTRTRKRYR